VWPSGRLHSDYMFEVSKTTASDPVHNVMLDVELILDVCIFDVRDSRHTNDFPETTRLECSLVSLSVYRFQSCRSKFLLPWSCIH